MGEEGNRVHCRCVDPKRMLQCNYDYFSKVLDMILNSLAPQSDVSVIAGRLMDREVGTSNRSQTGFGSDDGSAFYMSCSEP